MSRVESCLCPPQELTVVHSKQIYSDCGNPKSVGAKATCLHGGTNMQQMECCVSISFVNEKMLRCHTIFRRSNLPRLFAQPKHQPRGFVFSLFTCACALHSTKMAAAWRPFGQQFVRRISVQYVAAKPKGIRAWIPKRFPLLVACGCAGGSVIAWYAYKKSRYVPAMAMPKVKNRIQTSNF